MKKFSERIPLLVRRGGRDIKKNGAKPTFVEAAGVVADTPSFKSNSKTWFVSDHPGCGAKVGFAKISLLPQPPLLTRRGMRLLKHNSNPFRDRYSFQRTF
jgi:hypothetical protein